MIVGQWGLILGMLVAIVIRINCNKDTLSSIIISTKQDRIAFVKDTLFKFVLIAIPCGICLFLTEDIIQFISMVSSILCPLFIVVFPVLMVLSIRK